MENNKDSKQPEKLSAKEWIKNKMLNTDQKNLQINENNSKTTTDNSNNSMNNSTTPRKMSLTEEMYVKKRDGSKQDVSFDKILQRVQNLGREADISIPYTSLVVKVIDQLYNGIETTEIDELTAQQCASMQTIHPDYEVLAARILISNHHKNTSDCFSEVVDKLHNFKDVHNKHKPLVSKNTFDIVMNENNKATFNEMIDYSRDFSFDYFGFKTLERAYLMRINKIIVERPQHMWLSVAIQIHGDNMDKVKKTYDLMSQKYFTHATPTLFNSGTPRPQLSSCYLISMEDDSIDGIYNTLTDCAKISKWAGGIGLHIHNVRASGSHIRGTNGTSNGIIPMLKVFNNTARYVDQGGGKRNGSFAIYIEPWHADIEDFLNLKKNHGDEEMRARDLFYALWIPDLFMKRVKTGGMWTLMCPDECPGLSDCYGDEFERLYAKYEAEGKGRKTIKARDIWFKILDSQVETGTPYILFKDPSNKKSNQKNLGVIKSSNLCTEIIEYSDSKETAVCNLASIGLAKFVEENKVDITKSSIKIFSKTKCNYCKKVKEYLNQKEIAFQEVNLDDDKSRERFYQRISQEQNKTIHSVPQIYIDNKYVGGHDDFIKYIKPKKTYRFDKLHEVTKIVTDNLNNIIDKNYYPTEKTLRSNMMHRPIGIGVQGLADTFAMIDIPYDSQEAVALNKDIFETIYHASLERSCEISLERSVYMNKICEAYKKKQITVDVSLEPHSKVIIANDSTPKEIIDLINKYKPTIAEVKSEYAHGAYSTFVGSPASKGILQFDMWGQEHKPKNRYNWNNLKNEIKIHGLRNSLLVAPMPTASTSQILGNNECFEPFTNNVYSRRTIAGDYVIANKYMIRELLKHKLWNEEICNSVIEHNGSIQHLKQIPQHIRNKYKIVWEIPMKHMINMASDRGAFICQSQSLNLWQADPNYKSLTAMHFYSWEKGLKTGIYYLRRKPRAAPQQFTVDPSTTTSEVEKESEAQPEEPCEMCSS